MAGYRDLLRTPGVARIIAAQLTARFPNGMTSLAILLHVERQTGSYRAAGPPLVARRVLPGAAGSRGAWALSVSSAAAYLTSARDTSRAENTMRGTSGYMRIARESNTGGTWWLSLLYVALIVAASVSGIFSLGIASFVLRSETSPVDIARMLCAVAAAGGAPLRAAISLFSGAWRP